jgi:CheY-like chemotaxis protein
MSIPYGPILVVEDIPNILQLLEFTLKYKGYPVITASNGQEALERIEGEHPALVVTDILMPRMDGFALVQKIRTNPRTNDIPIIILSATFVAPEDRAFAVKLGARRFLEKPVDTEEFLLSVAEVLTDGPTQMPPPLGKGEFYRGYRERLENKLRHKNGQIARTVRLLESLPEEQKPAFQALLEEACGQRDEIQQELDQLFNLLQRYNAS